MSSRKAKRDELTCCEHMIPPVRLADESLQVVGRLSHDNSRRADDGPDGEEDGEDGHDDTESLDEVEVRNFHSFSRTYSEYDGNSTYKRNKHKSVKAVILKRKFRRRRKRKFKKANTKCKIFM